MFSIPTSPKSPTFYFVGESPGNTQLKSRDEIALKTLKFDSCAIAELQTAPDVTAADRRKILEFLQDE